MPSKPFPDFEAPEFRFKSCRARLLALREYVLSHDGPVPKDEAIKLFDETLQVAIDLIGESRLVDKFSLDAHAIERLLRETQSLLQPACA